MANHYKNKVRRNFIGNVKVFMSDHAVIRFVERQNLDPAGLDINAVRTEIIRKFRNSKLGGFLANGKERRYEVAGSMNERMQFICKKEECGKYVIISCQLQGKRNDWWKNEGLVKNA
ncbi:hypothetical protein Slash_79 [Bacillus phage Slash]|uniref:Uncharacterized protein n=3 Tax=Slashvirus TaxID=1921709 RepID=U5PXW9_9CAUD|nr:hypothetical protein Staley_81 [Bacillus phage Staley]YP_008771981.1 hypothetical protein Slash_79 [Bacillus phage Slash]YP_009203683.1 hypothetical protein CPT_Stahl79 [Bacillus phage Stahl]AGY48368.1 hypothetical protein Slash_79 [Bacillus phage Slash]AGY48764.1 hypothetical protein Staley_81 [Bacillus phage Staley]AKA61507.1 hypothetical protein CPT_Stahl79 [Bacillus phage Stahl]